jgi:carbonic anhydrase
VEQRSERDDPFADVWAANASFAADFPLAALSGKAARGLAVITCMDTRIDPLAVLGQAPGDAKILRTAGARVTDDVLRSLVLAVHLLGATRVLVVPHTDCGLVGSDDQVRAQLADATGRARNDPAIAGYQPEAIADPSAAVADDVDRIRAHPLLGPDLVVGAAVYDVATGRLEPVDV